MPIGKYERALKPIADRLHAKTKLNPKTGCLEWQGARGSFGHGQLYRGGPKTGGRHLLMAHRVMWELTNGPIPEGLVVLHKCDVPWCVNPAHLRIGTKADNSADMVAKKRQMRGEALPQSRLTATQIDAIRRCKLTTKEIATLCGISQGHVSQIKTGKAWRPD